MRMTVWRFLRYSVCFCIITTLSCLTWQVDNVNQFTFRSERPEPFAKQHLRAEDILFKNDIKVDVNKIPKVFIYDLHPKFNRDIQSCLDPMETSRVRCFNLQEYGFGSLLYKEGELGVYNTDQFSLEVIIHHQLLNSKYRTLNATEADVFYIPAYFGLLNFCMDQRKQMSTLQKELFKSIQKMPYLSQGKPHLSTFSKIESEGTTPTFPFFSDLNCRRVSYICIEKMSNPVYRKLYGLENQNIIVAPYPSYVHLNKSRDVPQTMNMPSLESRRVFMFLATGSRRSNYFRNKIMDQFARPLSGKSFDQIFTQDKTSRPVDRVLLWTEECHYNHVNITIKWMQNSIFCLQPAGDSPTRKSFYDAIQSGCIPVVFNTKDKVDYPFDNVLNYRSFVVMIDSTRIEEDHEQVYDILKKIPSEEVTRLHNNVLSVVRLLQYSLPADKSHDSQFTDALDMIMHQIQGLYNL